MPSSWRIVLAAHSCSGEHLQCRRERQPESVRHRATGHLAIVHVKPLAWRPRDLARPSPYPGLEAFTENDAGVFFGRESRLAEALGIVDGLRRRDGSRVFTIIAPSGVGKSSFLPRGLWPPFARQSGVAPLVILRPGAGIMSGREGGLIHSLADWFRRAG